MVTKSEIGFHDGYKLWELTLTNSKNTEVRLTNYSGAIMSIKTADKSGKLVDVLLGYKDIEGYINGTSSQGALVGRYANRIGDAQFKLNGVTYKLAKNDGKNTLHGGNVGYNKRVWELLAADEDESGNHAVFGYTSPDGEENYPGAVAITVDYCLNDENELSITYDAVSDADTVLNLTNHSYFNLAGFDGGSVMHQQLQLFADSYTPVDGGLIPTGEIKAVKGTPFDFTALREIEDKTGVMDGYDHNFVLNNKGALEKAAYAYNPENGITMTTLTDMPAIQLYTANGLGGELGKDGKMMEKQTAFCLETQFCPDAPNHDNFKSATLKASDRYHHVTVYAFGVK